MLSRAPILLNCQNVYRVRHQNRHLPLALWYLPGVDVVLLKPSEVELAWRDAITMRCKEHDRDVKLLKDLDRLHRLVIAGAIQQNHCLVTPIRSDFVKLLHESHEIDLHHFGVTVALSQSKVRVTMIVKTRNH